MRPSTTTTMQVALRSIAVAVVMLLVGSCSFDPAQITLPRREAGNSFRIHVDLPSALNLPSKARVMLSGAQVGTLESVHIVDPTAGEPGHVRADIQIDEGVRLPVSTTAQLRQNTILGDIFINLAVPSSGRDEALMSDGFVIPDANTLPALQVEDVLSGMAVFLSGGALTSAQEIVDRVNSVMPAKPRETRRIANTLKQDLIDLAQHQNDIDRFLDAAEENIAAVRTNREALDYMLTEDGATTITGIADSLINLIGIIGALGDLGDALAFLAPLLREANAAARAFVPMVLNPGRPLNVSAPSNLNRLVDLVRNQLIPWAERPQVDIRRVHLGDAGQSSRSTVNADDQTDSIVRTLRMLGLVR